jgi:hypothetical protein
VHFKKKDSQHERTMTFNLGPSPQTNKEIEASCGAETNTEAIRTRLLSLSARRMGPRPTPTFDGFILLPEVDVVLGNCSCVVGTSLYPAIAWVCGARTPQPPAASQTGAVYLPERSGQNRISFGFGGGGGGSTVFFSDCREQRIIQACRRIYEKERKGGWGVGEGDIALADDVLRCGILLI